MSAILDSARKVLRRETPLDARIAGLEQAVEAARGRLDDTVLDPASEVVERAGKRLRLSAEHTVVALAGATGSGKSSTFNRLTGLDLAAVGVRRPTTSWTTACVWGDVGGDQLLEWLGIPPRHRVSRDSMLDTGHEGKELQGLVLLDLPDHDSTELSHHLEAERLVAMADLLVWVLDPQKYADAAIHDRFLRPMAAHQEVMLVVLNHIDEVPEARRAGMLDDVRRLLEADGLVDVPVLATSAETGEGIEGLRAAIAARVADKASMRTRFATDIAAAAESLTTASGLAEPAELKEREKHEVVDALCDAAGVPLVVDAVQRASTTRARQATGWPLTAWIARLRPDPLRRLHLDLGSGGKDLVSAARSSMPAANQVQRARVESEVRELCDRVGGDLSIPWARAMRRASNSRFEDLDDRLDRVITSTDLGLTRTPVWCRLVRVLQWVLVLAALAGGLWLGAYAVSSYLQLDLPRAPRVRDFPLPTLLLVGGIVSGALLALLSRALIAFGARSRARKADRQMRLGVAEVADELVFAPIEAELVAYRTVFDGLKRARG